MAAVSNSPFSSGMALSHLDLDSYDHHFQPGAYLETHAQHMVLWHADDGQKRMHR